MYAPTEFAASQRTVLAAFALNKSRERIVQIVWIFSLNREIFQMDKHSREWESSLKFPFDQFHLINKQKRNNCSVNFGSTNHSSRCKNVRSPLRLSSVFKSLHSNSHCFLCFCYMYFNFRFLLRTHSIWYIITSPLTVSFSLMAATAFIWLSLTQIYYPGGLHHHFSNEPNKWFFM